MAFVALAHQCAPMAMQVAKGTRQTLSGPTPNSSRPLTVETISEPLLCELGPLEDAKTPRVVLTWVQKVSARFEHLRYCAVSEIHAYVWSYRLAQYVYIVCDITTDDDDAQCLTFALGEPHDFDLYSPSVPDAAEAIHMISLLCSGIGAKIELTPRSRSGSGQVPSGVAFALFAKAAYVESGCIVLMSSHSVERGDLPVGFLRYLTPSEAWIAGLPVSEAVAPNASLVSLHERLETAA